MAKSMCAECCELWQDLQEAKDKYYFLFYDCLPDKMEGNYQYFPKENLQCFICLIESVKAAAERGEITLSPMRRDNLEEILIKMLHYYEIALRQDEHGEPKPQK